MTKKSIQNGGLIIGIILIVAGILVLVWPEMVRWIIGIALIVFGVLAIAKR